MPSPTARTLAALRKAGFLADVVERWLPIPGKPIRKDAFGFGDLLAVDRREPGVLLVQATSLANVSSRLAKARARPELAAWLKAGGRFEVWGWCKRAGRWRVKILAVRAEDLEPVVRTAAAAGAAGLAIPVGGSANLHARIK